MITNYSDLKLRVIEWAEHTTVNDAKAAEFIAAAERKAYRVLRLKDMEVTTTDYDEGVTATADKLITGDDPSFALTADVVEIKDAWTYRAITSATPPPTYLYGSRQPNLARAPLDRVKRMIYERAPGEYPMSFAREGARLWFAPLPADQFVRMTYWARPPYLSDSVSTNAVLSLAPEMLLYGAVAEAFLFIRKYDDAAQMDGRFAAELQTLQTETDRQEYAGGGLTQRSAFHG